MYKTVRLYLRTDKREEEILKWYAFCYRIALYQLMEQQQRRQGKWKEYVFSEQIAPSCRWHLSRCAKQLLKKKHPFREDGFRKAGIWDRRGALIVKEKLKLSFGKAFLTPFLVLEIAKQQAQDKLLDGEILRMDLFYDMVWYVNILLRKKDAEKGSL